MLMYGYIFLFCLFMKNYFGLILTMEYYYIGITKHTYFEAKLCLILSPYILFQKLTTVKKVLIKLNKLSNINFVI